MSANLFSQSHSVSSPNSGAVMPTHSTLNVDTSPADLPQPLLPSPTQTSATNTVPAKEVTSADPFNAGLQRGGAELFVLDFPANISPVAREIRRMPVKDAKTILITILSTHSETLIDDSAFIDPRKLAEGRKVDREVAQLADVICQRFNISAFMVEGANESHMNTIHQMTETYRSTVRQPSIP